MVEVLAADEPLPIGSRRLGPQIGNASRASSSRPRVLWRLCDDVALTAAYVDVNGRATELAGRAMLLPLPPD